MSTRPTPEQAEATQALAAEQDHAHEPTTDDPRPTGHAHDERPTTNATTNAHAHAHAHAHDGAAADIPLAPFAHEKLDAYQVALQMAALANRLAEQIPRGHRNIADHLGRAASNTVLLLAEGANRRGAAQKRQRFVESRGECGEVAAAADLLLAFGIGLQTDVEELKRLAGRVSAMLTGLIARLG